MGRLNVMSPKTTAVGDSVKGRLGGVSDGNSKNNVVDAICAPPWSPPGWRAHHTAAVLADRNPSLLRSPENFPHLTGAALPRNYLGGRSPRIRFVAAKLPQGGKQGGTMCAPEVPV